MAALVAIKAPAIFLSLSCLESAAADGSTGIAPVGVTIVKATDFWRSPSSMRRATQVSQFKSS